MLIINNYFWLHGRDMFFANKDLHRELLRQRGVFIQ
ncbi:carbon starvation induced protein CsiD, partial [Candidatus Pseudothioglobus singularis]|nr:carbon starvation induced protein CsiD [Candidatus Pseudothioglobus singularis]